MADSKEVATTTPSNSAVSKIDLSRPRYDQNTFGGRLRHFFQTVNPLNIFVSSRKLEEAAELVKQHKYVDSKDMRIAQTLLLHVHTHTHTLMHIYIHIQDVGRPLLIPQRSSYGRPSGCMTLPTTQTLERRCSSWDGCLSKCLVT